MPRTVADAKIESPTKRAKLKPSPVPYWRSIDAGGLHVGYRKGRDGGQWVGRRYVGKRPSQAPYEWHTFPGRADDNAAADGVLVLNYEQAMQAVRVWATAPKPVTYTLATALDDYEADLKTRGGDVANAARARAHLPAEWPARDLAAFTVPELKRWRGALAKKMTPAAANRTMTCLRACLNLAAEDHAITDRSWTAGLKSFSDATQSRNVILTDALVRQLVETCYVPRLDERIKDEKARQAAEAQAKEWAEAFGLLVEVLATTGARVSQVARIEVRDLQGDRSDPRLMMPTSKKGKSTKKVERRPVPIPAALALRLRTAASDRAQHAPLLVKPSDEAWAKNDHNRPFAASVERLRDKLREEGKKRGASAEAATKVITALDDATIYALRHSSIVRQLLAGVPIRVVAALHDTSTAMIEKTYSRHIADHTDSMTRRTLLDFAAPARDNIVNLGAR